MGNNEKIQETEESTFKVSDRRRFSPEGEVRTESGSSEESGAASQEIPEPISTTSSAGSETSQERGDPRALPAELSTLVLSLASAAQMALGLVSHPATGKPERNLPQAKHAIDLLGVLEQKTQGNLSAEEAQLLEVLLYQLRMQYVETARTSDENKIQV